MRHSTPSIWLLTATLSALGWTATVPVVRADCVVTTTDDSVSAGSLRTCLETARRGDTITFDSTVFDLVNSDAATVINVLSALPPLDDGNVTINASDRRVTVNGSAA